MSEVEMHGIIVYDTCGMFENMALGINIEITINGV